MKNNKEWEIEFDRLTVMPSYKEVGDTLYWDESYPESMYELCADKIKNFIRQTLQKAIEKRDEEIIEMIGSKFQLLTWEEDKSQFENQIADMRKKNYNQALQDIINKIQSKQL